MTLRKAAARRLYSPAESALKTSYLQHAGALLGRAVLSYSYCITIIFSLFFFVFTSSAWARSVPGRGP